ncbi:hypothetical protein KAI87_09895, partial [Myxococcota bacterium]|nr:hypothetical protein [Myxococcota bacterium]
GVDIVERTLSRPQADHSASSAVPSKDMLVVRAWAEKRTLDATPQASAMVSFPRMWTTKRGRYAKFKAPGAGVYGLVRARPTF